MSKVGADERDFAALVASTRSAVLRVLQPALGGHDAEEAAQEVFVRVYVALREGLVPDHPAAWVAGVARNVLREELRRRRSQRRLREQVLARLGPGWEGAVDGGDDLERFWLIRAAVDELPAELRSAVRLHYFNDAAVAAVARELAISPGAVKTRLWRARTALRATLEGEGMEEFMSTPATAVIGGEQRTAVFDAVHVMVYVGGTHHAVSPHTPPSFPGTGGLSLDDVRLVIDRLHEVRSAGLRPVSEVLGLYAATDVFYQHDPAQLWQMLRAAEIGNEAFQATEESLLEVTDGWRIGTDPDWQPKLEQLAQAGLRHVWFTVAGLGDTHDLIAGRVGAYDAIFRALDRCRTVGLGTGANLLVSKSSAGQVAQLARQLRECGAQRFLPTYIDAREQNLPEPEDLHELPPELPDWPDTNWGYAQFWANPTEHTEANLTRAALDAAGTDNDAVPALDQVLQLSVTGTFDLLVGLEDMPPQQRLGNLRDDPTADLYDAICNVAVPPPRPSDSELARRYGDLNSRHVYMGLPQLRRKWVTAWRNEVGNIPWIDGRSWWN